MFLVYTVETVYTTHRGQPCIFPLIEMCRLHLDSKTFMQQNHYSFQGELLALYSLTCILAVLIYFALSGT